MKARELIKLLQTVPEDTMVVLSVDEEGNGFGTIYSWEKDMAYDIESQEIGIPALTPEFKEIGFTEDEILELDEKRVVPAIVLFPE